MRRAFVLACVLLAASCRARTPAARFDLTDDWGRRIRLAEPARRIVSLAPATTELVFALGLGDRLVGRTTWCDWPPDAQRVASMGNGIEPNVEVVAAQRPDLVLVYPSDANRRAVRQLEALGISAAALQQDNITEWKATVRWVARAAGVAARADTLLSAFDRRLAAAAASRRATPSVFIAAEVNPPMAIGGGSFLSELVALAGGRNVFGGLKAPSAVVSLEAVVARNPDYVLVLGSDSEATSLARRPGWSTIPAVGRRRVIAVIGSEFSRPSPRLPDAVRALTKRLDPGPIL